MAKNMAAFFGGGMLSSSNFVLVTNNVVGLDLKFQKRERLSIIFLIII